MDLIWPANIIPNEMSWGLVDHTAVVVSPLSGATRTYPRPGTRWSVMYRLNAKSGAERHQMLALIAQLRGRANRVVLTDIARRRRGVFPTLELISNNTFATTVGWTPSAEVTLSASAHALRAVRDTVSADQTVRHGAVTTIAGAAYVFRVHSYIGRGSMDYRLRVGTSAGGNQLAADSADRTAGGVATLGCVASGSTTYPSILDGINGRSAGDFQHYQWPTFARCALVDNTPTGGIPQTGMGVYLKNLPTSTNDLIVAGDLVELGGELKCAVAALNSDSSGKGYLMFEPAMRAALVDSTPVVIHQPFGRFMLNTDTTEWSTVPGVLSDFELSFIEALV